MTTIRAIQQINTDRSVRWMAGSPGWTTLEIAGELAGEVGELANICKKLRRSEMGVPGNKVSDDVLLDQARGEIADVFIVLMLTASKLGIDLEDAVRETFNKKSEQMGFPERIRSLPADVEKHGRHSGHPCRKCGAFKVYITQDSSEDADYDIHCYGCGDHYREDGPDA